MRAVVNLQSDADLRGRGVDWNVMWPLYTRLGIRASRVPILDFTPADLAKHLDRATDEVRKHVDGGRKTYVRTSRANCYRHSEGRYLDASVPVLQAQVTRSVAAVLATCNGVGTKMMVPPPALAVVVTVIVPSLATATEATLAVAAGAV